MKMLLVLGVLVCSSCVLPSSRFVDYLGDARGVNDFVVEMKAPLCDRSDVSFQREELGLICATIVNDWESGMCGLTVLHAYKIERLLYCSKPTGVPGNYAWTDCGTCPRKNQYYVFDGEVRLLVIE